MVVPMETIFNQASGSAKMKMNEGKWKTKKQKTKVPKFDLHHQHSVSRYAVLGRIEKYHNSYHSV